MNVLTTHTVLEELYSTRVNKSRQKLQCEINHEQFTQKVRVQLFIAIPNHAES